MVLCGGEGMCVMLSRIGSGMERGINITEAAGMWGVGHMRLAVKSLG